MNDANGSIATEQVVVSAARLRAELENDSNVVVLEVRRADPGDAYASGHVPGARLVDFGRDLVGPPTTTSGDNPLPKPTQLQRRLIEWGIDDHSTVIVYTREGPAAATRAWWVLRWAGLERVHLLDGGLEAWRAAGGVLDRDVPPAGAGTATVRPGCMPVLSAAEASRLAATGHLLDARAADAYAGGQTRPGAAPKGHIPGAHSIPGSANFAGAALKDPSTLAEVYGAHLDGRPIGVYCGSGVAATTTVLALASLGLDAALFPGSWSAWITDPGRPIATGDEPGDLRA